MFKQSELDNMQQKAERLLSTGKDSKLNKREKTFMITGFEEKEI